MQRKEYAIHINAAPAKVYDAMLGLTNPDTYKHWTTAFNPTSSYEGTWQEGSTIKFLGTDGEGNKGGMLSIVEKNMPNSFVSIRHFGFIKGEEEITSGPEVEAWANGYENYTFTQESGQTHLVVSIDVVEAYLDFFNTTYPKALQLLKELVEGK